MRLQKKLALQILIGLMHVPKLHLDFETRSTVALTTSGVYRYAEDQSTDVILACYAIDEQPIQTWFAPHPIPKDLHAMLQNPDCVVVAHNAGFERQMLRFVLGPRYGWPVPPIERWDDTAARAARQSLPRSLGDAAAALGLQTQKDTEGKALMMRMCRPRRIIDGVPVWWDEPERMQRLAQYCATDVQVERELDKILFPLSPKEKRIWQLTELINDRGIAVDHEFASWAIDQAVEEQTRLNKELCELTDNAVGASTNVGAIKDWMHDRGHIVLEGEDDSLNKKAIQNLLNKRKLDEKVRRVLEIRRDGGKSSIAKYKAIRDRVSKDGRVRGNLVFCGASTGRFAGTGVQIQNLPRDTVKDWEGTRKKLPEDPQKLVTLSKMIRGTLRAAEGHRLLWADYSSIEACGLAWLAKEENLLKQFKENGKIYEEMAAKIFNVSVEEIGKDSFERWVGKTAVLGCGYGMGAKKFRLTCAAMGQDISEELSNQAVQTYRKECANISEFWGTIHAMAIRAVQNGVARYRNLRMNADKNWLVITLPSGRGLYYRNPNVVNVTGSYKDMDTVEYMSVHPITKQWVKEQTYGGKLTENIVQAVCRDILVGAMLELEDKNYNVVASVHDEIVCEVPNGFGSMDEMVRIMCAIPKWGQGFPINAEPKEGKRYGK